MPDDLYVHAHIHQVVHLLEQQTLGWVKSGDLLPIGFLMTHALGS
jgi:hypothetical protein